MAELRIRQKYNKRYPNTLNRCRRRYLGKEEQDLSIARSTIHVFLRKRIRIFPYKPRIVHQLQALDYGPWRTFSHVVLKTWNQITTFYLVSFFPMNASFTSAEKSTSIIFKYGEQKDLWRYSNMSVAALNSLSGVPYQGVRR